MNQSINASDKSLHSIWVATTSSTQHFAVGSFHLLNNWAMSTGRTATQVSIICMREYAMLMRASLRACMFILDLFRLGPIVLAALP